jgi:hypothetical protein
VFKLGSATYRGVGGYGIDVDVIKHDVLGTHHKRRPTRRVLEMKSLNLNIGGVVRQKQNWAVELIVWIQYFGAREAVPPCLTVAIDHTFTIYLDVPATPNPKCDALLEVVVEAISLPVLDVVGKLDSVKSLSPE